MWKQHVANKVFMKWNIRERNILAKRKTERDRFKVAAIFDCKQQRSAAAYRDLEAEVRQRSSRKPKNGKLLNREI